MENRNNHPTQEVMYVQHVHEIKATSKQIRKLGFDIGYGVTSGVFSAMFMVHLCLGIMKAVKKRAEKKVEAQTAKEAEATATEETADK